MSYLAFSDFEVFAKLNGFKRIANVAIVMPVFEKEITKEVIRRRSNDSDESLKFYQQIRINSICKRETQIHLTQYLGAELKLLRQKEGETKKAIVRTIIVPYKSPEGFLVKLKERSEDMTDFVVAGFRVFSKFCELGDCSGMKCVIGKLVGKSKNLRREVITCSKDNIQCKSKIVIPLEILLRKIQKSTKKERK